MKVLVAEDNATTRMVLRRAVEASGHECVAARDGEEAWKIFQQPEPMDAIVSDWMMPGIDGLELCRRVRAGERGGSTYFIFMTALNDKERLLEAMRAGADEFLTKPPNIEQLQAKLIAASRLVSMQRHLDTDTEKNGRTRVEPSTPRPGAGGAVAPPAGRRLKARGGKVWDILISQGKLSEDQVQQALETQQGDRRELGNVLVSLGFISEADLAQAQAERMGLEYVDLIESAVDRGVAHTVERKMLQKHDAMPLRMEDGRMKVALSDPTNLYALEDLRIVTGHPIVPVVATASQIQKVHAKIFDIDHEVGEILEEATAGVEEDTSGVIELGIVDGADEAPVVRLVDSMLRQAVADGASDIHVEPQVDELMVRFRVDGLLRTVMSVPQKLRAGVTARLKVLANLDIAERRIPQDGRFSVKLGAKKVDLRTASLPTAYGEGVVLRLLDASGMQIGLSQLGFPERVLESYREVFRRPYGAILVTGPTGSGKSTTLYATLDELNSPEKKIITVEDPVEYRMRGINQVQVNPKAGLTFAAGLRSILRNDPDIVMVGEIRDYETAKTSIEAAMTGHIVLATLHTNDAPGALNRLTDMGVEPFLASSAVDCVIAQRLARRLCDRCKQPAHIEREILEGMRFPLDKIPDGRFDFHRAVGCEWCGDSGYKGRLGIYELMVVTDEIRDLMLRRVSSAEIARAAKQAGMVTLREDGLIKAARGVTTIEEILRAVV